MVDILFLMIIWIIFIGAVDYIITNLLDNNYEIIGSLIYPELTLTNIVKTSSNEFIIRKLL